VIPKWHSTIPAHRADPTRAFAIPNAAAEEPADVFVGEDRHKLGEPFLDQTF
jgi:hypothetical protein